MTSKRKRQRRARRRKKDTARRSTRNISERQLLQRAMNLAQFCERYSIGKTKAYEELNRGRLRARKLGKRTIITEDDAEDWLRRLPSMFEAVEA